MIINEMLKNTELQLPKSVYMYRAGEAGAKIKMGPLWDFDYGFDYVSGNFIHKNEYFENAEEMYMNSVYYRAGSGRTFFNRFFEDPVFCATYKERWNMHYGDMVSMESFIDKMANLLIESQKADAAVWHWWRAKNYNREIEKMKTWWRARILYLNEQINQL
jgi:hypothetical protein